MLQKKTKKKKKIETKDFNYDFMFSSFSFCLMKAQIPNTKFFDLRENWNDNNNRKQRFAYWMYRKKKDEKLQINWLQEEKKI